MLTGGAQIVAVTLVSLRSLPQRLGSSSVAVAGITGVVVVFVAVLSIAEGFRATLRAGGDARTAIVMGAGSEEMSSRLSRESAEIVKDAPGILRGAGGLSASAELFVIVNHPKRSTGTTANVPLRGLEPTGFSVRPQARIVEGRSFEPGRHEIIVGRAAARQFEALEVGRRIEWGATTWTVVGIFEAQGAIWESELWCDVSVLQPAYRRSGTFSSVHVRLESPEAFGAFKAALVSDPRLDVAVHRETDYYAEQSRATARLIRTLGFAIAILMGAGAIFGAVNTMYSAVAARTREIATLRALGFGGGPVVLSVLAESVFLAATGGLLGGWVAWALLDGYQTTTLNWQTYTQVAFAFTVTPGLLLEGVVYAVAMGLVGGLLPAMHAARVPVAAALRDL
jgi:putative ABC transport system permease protein